MTKQSKALGIVAGLALAGALVMLAATRPGIGVPPDSTIYCDAANNLAAGRGFVVISGTSTELMPLTHYPPLYPALLAFAITGGATVETAARWLNAILFGVNIFLIGLSITFCARESFWLPVVGALLTLAAPDMLAMHSVALTEPLYLTLTFAGLLALGSYLQNQRRRFLLVGAILIAFSVLTRYVGVTGVITGAGALFLLKRQDSESGGVGISLPGKIVNGKVFDIFTFVAVSCAPIALWTIRNRVVTGGASDRQLAFHPLKLQQIVAAFSTSAQWLLLGKVRLDVRFLVFVIEVVVAAGLTIYLIKKGTHASGDSVEARIMLPHLLGILMIVYVAFLILTITFFEADNVLDSRSLLPVHFALLVLGPLLARLLYARAPVSGSVRTVVVVGALLLAGSYTFRGGRWLVRAQADGQGFASRAWKESPTVLQIRKLPLGVPIYSNGRDAIYYLSGRGVRDIPAKFIRGTGLPNPHYDAELQRMSDELRRRHGVLVYFNTFPERWTMPPESELQSQLPLIEVVALPDGSIYRMDFEH